MQDDVVVEIAAVLMRAEYLMSVGRKEKGRYGGVLNYARRYHEIYAS